MFEMNIPTGTYLPSQILKMMLRKVSYLGA